MKVVVEIVEMTNTNILLQGAIINDVKDLNAAYNGHFVSVAFCANFLPKEECQMDENIELLLSPLDSLRATLEADT